MDKLKYISMAGHITEAKKRIVSERGSNYANDDFISSFKRVGPALECLGINQLSGRYQHAATMVVVKLDRIIHSLRDNDSEYQSRLLDSVVDLENYLEMLCALTIDDKDDEENNGAATC